MLNIETLSKTFKNGTTAFRNVSFKVQEGEVVGLLGTSGCGKSTMLRVIAGLENRYDGKIELDGSPIRGIDPRIGLMFQEPRLMPWLKLRENVAFGLDPTGRKSAPIVDEYIKLVGLEGKESLYPKECSGGMAQRTAIARALVTQPEILLLDEPLSALDAFIKMQLQDLLLDIWQTKKTTMILVTHDIDEALYLCDRIIVLRGQPGELYREIAVEQRRPRVRGDIYLANLKAKILETLDLSRDVEKEVNFSI